MKIVDVRMMSTGSKELDDILGGFPEGAIVLVAGHPGAGKTTLAAQFIYAGLKAGSPGLYVSLSERKELFYMHMKGLGFNFAYYEERGLFKFVWLPLMKNIVSPLNEVLMNIRETGCNRLVIDPITALIDQVGREGGREFLHNLINVGLRPAGVTTLLIADLPYGREVIGYGFEEFLVDGILVLRYEEARGLMKRMIEIRKSRWSDIPRISYEFVIGEGGLHIYTPYVKGLKGGFDAEKRHSTGVEELDEMLSGGLPRGSAVLIAGPSGTGKTMLALTMSLTEVNGGGSAVYLSFEEPEGQLYQVARMLGMRKDSLHITSISPRQYTPGAIYHYVSSLVENVKPGILVLDGLSALERQYGSEYMELIKSIGLLCKAEGVTLIMTSLHDMLKGERAGISTLADVVIALTFERRDDTRCRRISVLKARAVPHDTRVRDMEIVESRIYIR